MRTDGRATVVRVIDGDTIVVHIGGRDENTRLLGIDTSKPQKTPLRLGTPHNRSTRPLAP
jgi:endonuclease YncB( thermonuclease family)